MQRIEIWGLYVLFVVIAALSCITTNNEDSVQRVHKQYGHKYIRTDSDLGSLWNI